MITLADYQRIFRVISSVLDSVEVNTPHACIFFAVAGAFIIEQVHKRPARPVAGAAFYRVSDETGFTMAFGRLSEDGAFSDPEAFHCWIESGETIIDLMAPIFQEAISSADRSERVPRRMLQKPLAAMSCSPYSLEKEGDFFLQNNPQLGLELLEHFLSKPANGDLVNMCLHWYKPQPKPMQQFIQMGSNDGSVTTIRLSQVEIVGAW